MAKGNLFLGTAQNKVGDVVMYRRDGVQLSRVRVRTIANPRSVGQSVQRNYVAPVSKFYAPLAGVLETSWEGLTRSASHNAFNKANINLARSRGWFLPKGTGFFPLPYQLSLGILPQMIYSMNTDGEFTMRIGGGQASADITVADLTQRMIGLGYQDGDQVTLILVVTVQGGDGLYRPVWSRFLLSSTDNSRVATHLPPTVEISGSAGTLTISGSATFDVVAGAVIVSRYSSSRAVWLRSTQFLAVDADLMASVTDGAAYQSVIDTYGNGSSIVQSAVYLNGGTDTGADAVSLSGPTVTASISGSPIDVQLTSVQPLDLFDGSTRVGTFLAVRGSRASNGATAVVFLVKSGDTPSADQVYDTESDELITKPSAVQAYYAVDLGDTDTVAWLQRNGVPDDFFA